MRFKTKAFIALIIVSLIACTVCVTGNMLYREDGFTPRLTPPLRNNTCYYSSNIFYSSGFGMPNCTAYAWGRAYEILGKRPNLSLSDAGQWYQYNKDNSIYPYGKTPKIGAIACFDNRDGGHVAVVEKIENGTITFSNSAYGGSNFYLSYAKVSDKNPGQEGWKFQGYIYLKENCDESVSLNSVRSVNCNFLNLRSDIGLNSEVIQCIPKNSQLFISNIYQLDGYTWGKTTYNGKTGYCVIEYTTSMM